MLKNVIDILVGFFIVVIVVFICHDWYQRTNVSDGRDHYKLYADFTDMTGIEIGSDIKISGIPVGYVSGYSLDPHSYMARVVMSLHNSIKIPVDTMASVVGEGIFGKKYLKLSPGSQQTFYNENDVLELTQPPINMETIITGLLFKDND